MDDGGVALMADNRMNNTRSFKKQLIVIWILLGISVMFLYAVAK